jgi:hypothetical protein
MYVQAVAMTYVQACRCSVRDNRMCATGGGSICACRVPARNCIELLILHWTACALVT